MQSHPRLTAAAVWLPLALAAGAFAGPVAAGRQGAAPAPSIRHERFGVMPDGEPVEIYTLTNRRGMTVRAMSYGATIVSITVPDREGRLADVVLGFDGLAGYLASPRYIGCVVGRYGNRIARGRFTLDGRDYQLAVNNGQNHLHGGDRGFDKRVWAHRELRTADGIGVLFSRTSPDNEEKYPGTLKVSVAYVLSPRNELRLTYTATTDRATPVNLTQHTFFNLAGDASGDVLGQQLTIDAARYTPVDATQIPTGELAAVAGTPFDFRRSVAIGTRIGAADEQLARGGGYDHNFALDPARQALRHAVRAIDPASGRTLDVITTEPGVQFSTGNRFDGTTIGKGGRAYPKHAGFTLETQHFPDSPNHPAFPPAILRPGQTYRSTTVWRFGTVR